MVGGAFFWLMALGSAAMGQEIPPGVGSADRPRPEYKPVGIHRGAFFIYPSLAIRSAYDDNIYASNETRIRDYKMGVAPQLKVESDWGRHSLAATAYSDSTFHADTSREDYTDWGASGQGRLDVSDTTSIEARAAFARINQDRVNINTPAITKHRVVYDQLIGQVRIRHTLNRLELMLQGQILTSDFKDAQLLSGGPLDQDFRDDMEMEGLFQAAYTFSPGYGAFIQANVNQRDYALSPGDPEFIPGVDFDRDSRGYEVEAGLAFEVTHLLYGNIRGGYLKQIYESPFFPNVSGPSFGAGLLWNVTTLTSLRLDGDRQVYDSTIPFSGGLLTSEVSLGVDHELLRNFIVTLEGTYRNLDFRGIDRSDNYYQAEAGVRYLLNRHMTFDASCQYQMRRSSAGVQEFSRNLIQASLTLYL